MKWTCVFGCLRCSYDCLDCPSGGSENESRKLLLRGEGFLATSNSMERVDRGKCDDDGLNSISEQLHSELNFQFATQLQNKTKSFHSTIVVI